MTQRANYLILAAKGMEILLNLKTYHHVGCYKQGASGGRFGSVLLIGALLIGALLIGALLMETSRELH